MLTRNTEQLRYEYLFVLLYFSWLLAGCSKAAGFDTNLRSTPTAERGTATNPTQILPNKSTTPTRFPILTQTPTITRRPFQTATPTREFIQLSDLPPGEYILYSVYDSRNKYYSDKYISYLGVISSKGIFYGILMEIDDVYGSSLSPDKTHFAFVYSGSPYPSNPNVDMLTTSIMDMVTMQQTPQDFGDMECGMPGWSPDSLQIALNCFNDDNYPGIDDIFILTLPTVSLVRLPICTDDIHVCSAPEWSPNGKWIAYAIGLGGNGLDNRVGLHLINTDCLKTPDTCKQMDRGPYEAGAPYAWSPDSRLLAGYWDGFLRIFDVSDSGQLTKKDDIKVDYPIDSIVWSPNGNQLAYTYGDGQIYTISLDDLKSTSLYGSAVALRVLNWITMP